MEKIANESSVNCDGFRGQCSGRGQSTIVVCSPGETRTSTVVISPYGRGRPERSEVPILSPTMNGIGAVPWWKKKGRGKPCQNAVE